MTTNLIIWGGVAELTNLTSIEAKGPLPASEPHLAAWLSLVVILAAICVGLIASIFAWRLWWPFRSWPSGPQPLSQWPISEYRAFMGTVIGLRLGIVIFFVGIADGAYNCIPQLDADKVLAAGVALFLAALGTKGKE